jgi:LDH2 family malate/lactate/ureidoglycolate dehydrogenase
MGILSSLLSGASYGSELGDMVTGARPGKDGHFFMALSVSAFEDVAVFKQRVDTIITEIRQSPRAAGVEQVYAPGGLEVETEARYRADGIPLNAETIGGIVSVARKLKVPTAALDTFTGR